VSEQSDSGTEHETDPRTITRTVFGAWKEALGSDGVERVALVSLVALMTIPFAPFWILLAALEALGVYSCSVDTDTEQEGSR
jgi:hypothetical protein